MMLDPWNIDVDYSTYITPDNQLLEVKYAFNLGTLIYMYVGILISQITQIFSYCNLCIAVARHNFKWLRI